MPAEAHAEGLRVAEILRRLVLDRSSIRAVEDAAGWSQSTLAGVFSGRQPLRFSHAAAICQAVGVPLEDFYLELSGKPVSREIVPGLTEAELYKTVRDMVRRASKDNE